MSDPFPWKTLRSMIGGESAVDVPRLHLRTRTEAVEFMASYGYDWDLPVHREEVERIRQEALEFIQSELANQQGLKVPDFLREIDPRDLLLCASSSANDPRQQWACATLRVMHTFAHCDMYFNDQFGPQIRHQILDRFIPHLFGASSDGGLMLGNGPGAIPLADFSIKHTKPKRSVAMKLLHKVENVASDVFDRFGLRFITRERFDTLLVARYLRAHNVIMFANIKPSRSRNTLIDIDWLESAVDSMDPNTDQETRLDEMRELTRNCPMPDPVPRDVNAFSSPAYRTLQFTCRQLIRVVNPDRQAIKRIHDNALDRLGPGDPTVAALAQQLRISPPEVRFFFPFEIQIMDEDSYVESRSGLASHREYKERQRTAVCFRVLGNLLAEEPNVVPIELPASSSASDTLTDAPTDDDVTPELSA